MKHRIVRACGHEAKVKVYSPAGHFEREKGAILPFRGDEQGRHETLVLFRERQKLCPVCRAQAKEEARHAGIKIV